MHLLCRKTFCLALSSVTSAFIAFASFVGCVVLSSCGGAGGNSGGGTQPPTITSVTVTCTPTGVQTGKTSQCSASVTGTGSYGSAVTWSAGSGTISSSGSYTAPATVPASGTDTIKATSTQDSTKSGSATVTVTVASTITSVAVACSPSSILTTQTSTCTPTVTGTGTFSSAVTWSVSPTSIGSITSAGVFTATSTGTATITATSTQDTTKSGFATISVPALGGVIVTPSSAQVEIFHSQQFSATFDGVIGAAVTWAVNGTVGGDLTIGQIDSSGLYTAPNSVPSPATVTVTATSQVDPVQSASATITLQTDTIAPTVLSTSPTSGATGVAVAPTITAQFSEGMDQATINPTTITLSNGTSILPARTSYDPSTYSVTLIPNGVLGIGETYTATIGTGVSDSAENSLATAYSWSFTVEPPVTVSAVVAAPTGLDTTTLTALSFAGQETTPDGSGNFSADVRPEGISLIAAMLPGKPFGFLAMTIPGSQLTPDINAQSANLRTVQNASAARIPVNHGRWQITASPNVTASASTIALDFQTTAESFLFMTPYLYVSDPERAEPIMAAIAADSNTAVLATALSSTWSEVDPFNDPSVKQATQNALISILESLANVTATANSPSPAAQEISAELTAGAASLNATTTTIHHCRC